MEFALDAEKRYPDKRLIIHFMQPHYPFIKDLDLIHKNLGLREIKDPIKLAISGNPLNSFKEVYGAYKRNLKAILP